MEQPDKKPATAARGRRPPTNIDSDTTPKFSISISGASEFHISQNYEFEATLHYDWAPPDQDASPVVINLHDTPLHNGAGDWNVFAVSKSPSFEKGDLVPLRLVLPCFRKPRGPDGRFLKHIKYEISAAAGFVELGVQESVTRKIIFDREKWAPLLELGKTYFVRLDPANSNDLARRRFITNWRYGLLSDFENVPGDYTDDEKERVKSRLPYSNIISFKVVP